MGERWDICMSDLACIAQVTTGCSALKVRRTTKSGVFPLRSFGRNPHRVLSVGICNKLLGHFVHHGQGRRRSFVDEGIEHAQRVFSQCMHLSGHNNFMSLSLSPCKTILLKCKTVYPFRETSLASSDRSV